MNFRDQIRTAYYSSGIQEKYKEFSILYDGGNYLAKMCTDAGFLANSEYAKLFNISKRPDPFLLAPATPYSVIKGVSKRRQLDALKGGPFIELPIPVPILKRIKAVEPILMEELRATPAREPMSDSKANEPRNDILEGMIPSSTTQNFTHRNDSGLHHDYMSHKSETEAEKTPLSPLHPQPPSLFPLKITDSDIPKFLEWYQSKLSDKFTKSYSPLGQLLEKTQSGYTPMWLCYASGKCPNIAELLRTNSMDGTIHGLAVFHVDPASQIRSRVLILHASVLEETEQANKLPDFLKQLADYIWRNVNCDEIRVELSHFVQEEGKLAPYDELKNAFQGLQFKWKTLISDQQGNRVVVLGANRPENEVFDAKGVNCKNEPITFKHAVVLSVSEGEAEPKRCTSEGPQSLCSYVEALKSYSKKDGKCELELKNTKDSLTSSLMDAAAKISSIVTLLAVIIGSLACYERSVCR